MGKKGKGKEIGRARHTWEGTDVGAGEGKVLREGRRAAELCRLQLPRVSDKVKSLSLAHPGLPPPNPPRPRDKK